MSIRYSDDFKKAPESNEAREIRRLNQLLNEKDKEILM